MTRNERDLLVSAKKETILRIQKEIDEIDRIYCLSELERCGYKVGQRIEYEGKLYEIVGASFFVYPCPDGRLVRKDGTLGKDVRQLYNIRLK